MKRIALLFLLMTGVLLSAQVRLKDVTHLRGEEDLSLIGYGLVVGLDGSGDGSSSQVTVQSIKNMLERFGISVPMNKIRPNNVAAVMVTATVPAFTKSGSRFDVTVASVGDAKSLEGGNLLMTPLLDEEHNKYAVAQGEVSVGGFTAGSKQASVKSNYTLVGRIPNGAMLEREVVGQVVRDGDLLINLENSDYTTAQRVADAINTEFDLRLASPLDPTTVQVIVPDSVSATNRLVAFISRIENLSVTPEQKARVVINERTGTIVAGGNVRITAVAVSHGSLTIKVNSETESQWAGPFGQSQSSSDVAVMPESGQVMVLRASTVEELVQALNAIKVTPRDLISIFQALKSAGALQAELVVL
jgi:flagellar P-ring protein precursor FlgI